MTPTRPRRPLRSLSRGALAYEVTRRNDEATTAALLATAWPAESARRRLLAFADEVEAMGSHAMAARARRVASDIEA